MDWSAAVIVVFGCSTLIVYLASCDCKCSVIRSGGAVVWSATVIVVFGCFTLIVHLASCDC